MKFKVMMKDPDTLYDAIDDAVRNIILSPGLDAEEQDLVRKKRNDEIRSLCQSWFDYGEYLTVEIDTEARTCTVVPV